MASFFFIVFVPVVSFLAGCKTTPYNAPVADLHFTAIEAQDTSKMYLDYVLAVTNPDRVNAEFRIEEWNAVINNREIKNGLALTADNSTGRIRLELDIPALMAEGVPFADDCTVDLTLNINSLHPPARIQAKETAVFPFIREPVFAITAIAILKAELVNTRFKVTIHIENPNNFQVDLASLEYELFGNGLLWAEGRERNIIVVPARSSYQGDLFLTMNFINMRRDLLDQIIRLQDVHYGFNGEAFVGTGVDYLPRFRTNFNLSGYSKVLDADK